MDGLSGLSAFAFLRSRSKFHSGMLEYYHYVMYCDVLVLVFLSLSRSFSERLFP